MKAIQYIGSKPEKKDNVAGTGLAWMPGQTLVVADDGAAFRLLAHPRIWREAPLDDAPPLLAAAAGAALSTTSTDDTVTSIASQPTFDPGQYKAGVPETPGAVHVPTPNLQSMTKAELIAHGQSEFRENIDAKLNKDEMVQRLTDMHAERTARQAAEGQGQ